MAVPGDDPTLTYTMVRYGGVPGDRVTSEFYDPFYYLPAGYHYADHRDVAGPLIQRWMSSTQMRLLLMPAASAFDHSVPDYQAFMADHPGWFVDTRARLGDGMSLFAVHFFFSSRRRHTRCSRDWSSDVCSSDLSSSLGQSWAMNRSRGNLTPSSSRLVLAFMRPLLSSRAR